MYSTSVATTSYKRKFKRTNNVANKSNTRAPGERSTEGSEQGGRSVPIKTVHFETREEKSTCIQSQITEPLRTVGEIQIGGLRDGSNSSPPRRLPDETRLTGRIFHGPHTRPNLHTDKIYEFQCLPFGLSSAPRAFTRLLKPVVAVLRSSGIRIVIYLDDLLIMHQDRQEIVKIFNMVLALLKNLGFLIKVEKCSLYPTQALVFLGALLDPKKLTIAVPMKKLQDLQRESANVAKKEACSMHELASMIGRMNQMARIGIHQAPLHYRALQRAYIGCLHKNGRHTRSQHVQVSLN